MKRLKGPLLLALVSAVSAALATIVVLLIFR
jgi:hypothetical protein